MCSYTHHVGDIRGKMEDARHTLLYADRYMAELGKAVDQLSRQKLSDRQVYGYIDALFPLAGNATEIQKQNLLRMKEEVKVRYFDAPDLKHTENYKPIKEKSNNWNIVLEHMKKRKKAMLVIVWMSIVSYALQMSVPIMIQKIIDSESIHNYGFVVIGLAMLLGIINFFRGKKLIILQIETDFHLSKSVFSKILMLPYKYFEGRTPGDILFRMSSITSIRDLLSEQLVQTVMQAGALVFIFVYMFMKSASITLVATVLFIITGVFIISMKTLISEVNQDDMMKNTMLQTVQVETIYSMFAIKTSGMEDETWKNWKKAYERCLNSYGKKSCVINI